jgi:hypothetical protein
MFREIHLVRYYMIQLCNWIHSACYNEEHNLRLLTDRDKSCFDPCYKASVPVNTIIIVYLVICPHCLLQRSSALATDFVLNPYLIFSRVSTQIQWNIDTNSMAFDTNSMAYRHKFNGISTHIYWNIDTNWMAYRNKFNSISTQIQRHIETNPVAYRHKFNDISTQMQ